MALPFASVPLKPFSPPSKPSKPSISSSFSFISSLSSKRPPRDSFPRALRFALALGAAAARGQASPSTLSAAEVLRLLESAPSVAHALQLAAKLRRAAREERSMKDGRSLSVEAIDEALDLFLDREEEGEEEEEEEEREEGEEEEEEEREEEWVERWGEESEEREPSESFEAEGRRGETLEDWEDGEEEADLSEEDEDHREETKQIAVPQELWEEVICRKFNVVDRVWKAPTSATLPKAPSTDSISENAWLRLPHIAVNGMTNCGKSTLINHILRWTYAAKASSVPGRTKSIDFYCINNRFVLVDLPGYPDPEELAHQGVLKKWEAHWQDLVLTYLQMCADGRYDLRLMLQLQATKRRPSRACRRFVQELKEKDLPLLLVLTKDDQLKKPNEERNYFATQIKKTLQLEGQHLHYTAKGMLAMSRRSKKHLQRWIRTAVIAKDATEVKRIMKDAWENRRICETLKTPEELQAKKDKWKAHYKALREERKREKAKAQSQVKLRIRVPK